MRTTSGANQTRARALWPTIGHGILLGTLAVVVICMAITLLLLLTTPARNPSEMSQPPAYAFPVLIGISIFALTILPASIGGGTNALVLYLLFQHRAPTLSTGLGIGGLIGVLGSMTVFISMNRLVSQLFNVAGGPIIDPRNVEPNIVLAAVSLVVGCWHGWRMVRYLERSS